MEAIQSPITTIPGIGVRMGAMILAEIGDFSRFDSPDKILAYAGLSPSTYQSGQFSIHFYSSLITGISRMVFVPSYKSLSQRMLTLRPKISKSRMKTFLIPICSLILTETSYKDSH